MRRRAFLIGAPALLAAPLAEAPAPGNVPRVGVLTVNRSDGPQLQRNSGALRQGLRDLGWIAGKNIIIEERFGEGEYERLPGLTADLVRLKVAVIVGAMTPLIRVVQETAKTTPVVMVAILDPIAAGFIGRLARPGRSITGLTSLAGPELIGK